MSAAAAPFSNDSHIYRGYSPLDTNDPRYYSPYSTPLTVDQISYKKADAAAERCRDDFEFYCDFWHDLILEPKQKEFGIHADIERETAMVSTRQGGKSTIAVLKGLHSGQYQKNIFIESYSPTEKQAIRVLFARARQLLESQEALWDEIKTCRHGYIEWYNGNYWQFNTAGGQSQNRGFSPSRYLFDECQSIADEKIYGDILGSGLALKGIDPAIRRKLKQLPAKERQAQMQKHGSKAKIWTIGTPLGRGYFRDAIEEPGPGTYVIRQPWWECSFIDISLVEKFKRTMPRKVFEAEFCCIFHTDEGFAFAKEDIEAAISSNVIRGYPRVRNGLYAAGMDLGQKEDHSVMKIVQVVGAARQEVYSYSWDLATKWHIIAQETLDILDFWKPACALFDCTGRYNNEFESYFLPMRNKGHWIEGWTYTQDTKAEIIQRLQNLFEKRLIIILDDEEVIKEYKKFPETRSVTGKFKYENPSHVPDDHVNAMALACTAAELAFGRDGIPQGIVVQAMQHHDWTAGMQSPWATEIMGTGELPGSVLQRSPRSPGRKKPRQTVDNSWQDTPDIDWDNADWEEMGSYMD